MDIMNTLEEFEILRQLDTDLKNKIKLIIIFGVEGNHVIIKTKTDLVYGFGDNDWGRLGFGHEIGVTEPTPVTDLSNKQIIDICYGDRHVLALTRGGRCLSWGDNHYHQLGYQSNERINKPKFIQSLSENNLIITAISCGVYHSMVLTDTGDVHTFGDNYFRQLGFEENSGSIKKIEIGSKVTAISCGAYHSLALTETGRVYVWGLNDYKQCSNKCVPHSPPVVIDIPSKVCQISCGFNHSLALTEEKQIYSIGCIKCFANSYITDNESEECTHRKSIIQKPFGDNRFTDIATHHSIQLSIGLSEEGFCHIWGPIGADFCEATDITEFQCLDTAFSRNTLKTYKPIIFADFVLKSDTNTINEKMKNLFNNQNNSDFKFKIENKFIFVHKFILKFRCEHFKTLFNEKWDKLLENELEIKEYSYQTFYSFIKYLYTDLIELDSEYIFELYDLSNSYFEELVKQKCVEIMKRNITIENVLTLYSFSLKYELQELEMCCLEFCSNKWNQLFITDNFSNFDKSLGLKFIKSAAHLKLF